MVSEPVPAAWVEWSEAGRSRAGEAVSADRAVVLVRGRRALVAVIDGLGHGTDAASAADRAAAALRTHGPADDVARAVARTHDALVGTRGAVATIGIIDADRGTLEWTGVGDVEGAVFRAGRRIDSLLLRAGVLGDRPPATRVSARDLRAGDLLVLATDGVRRSFMDEPLGGEATDELAARILANHGRTSDDALVLVVRYRGPSA